MLVYERLKKRNREFNLVFGMDKPCYVGAGTTCASVLYQY